MQERPGDCPRCGEPYAQLQEYCVACGLRLPGGRGLLPAAGRLWRLQVSQHPGGWLWVIVALLALAVVATLAAIVASDEGESAVRTIVATEPAPATARTPTLTAFEATTSPAETATTATATAPTTTAPRRANAPVEWPAGRSGHTVVVASLPTTAGREAALGQARAAVRAGLPNVGVLDSSEFASLRPGYFVVFSGIYESTEEALEAVEAAQARGYPRAYEREITP